MYASSGTGTVSLTTYTNNSTYTDDWNIAKIGYMSEAATLEGKQGGGWYWDRFLVYSNISSSLSTQKSYYKKINDGG